MKTTIELPDDLLVAAKKKAADLRRPLRELIERALRRELRDHRASRPLPRRRVRWVTVAGGLPPHLDLADRASMHNWLRRG